MNDMQIFQIFGIALFTMGIAWAINPPGFDQLIKDIARNRGVLLLFGLMTIVVGYLLITVYKTNSMIIEVLGWIAFIKGFVIIVLSSTNIGFSAFFVWMKKYYVLAPWCVLAVGLLALYFGYFA